ncbi:hypothetical protein XHV734_p0024 (plasmid) [Xanthomonas hortorum pv. vitians]|nr:hypothetical protein XHV734_p0024 [Xanthomonas hortorum pv. vitians]
MGRSLRARPRELTTRQGHQVEMAQGPPGTRQWARLNWGHDDAGACEALSVGACPYTPDQ